MLEYEKTDISEGIDVNKSKNSRKCSLCHFWYFTDKKFNYGPYLCNGCHGMSMKVVSLKNLAIIHFVFISKNDATNLLNNTTLNNKGEL